MKTKSFNLLFLLLIAAMINSCTTHEQADKKDPVKEFRTGLTALNQDDQKVIFDGLPAEIKCAVWKDHLEEELQTNLSQNQKELLKEMLQHLTPAAYDSASGIGFKSYVNEWSTKAKTAFANADTTKLEDICMHLGSHNQTTAILQQAQLPNCDCELGAWINCPINFTCKARPCTVRRCGLFWIWRCDGRCI